MWTENAKPQFYGKMRHLEAYDDHHLTLLGSLTCDVEWNGSRQIQKQLAVVQSDKEFGLLGRDLLSKHGVNNITTEPYPLWRATKLMWSCYQNHNQCSAKPEKKPLPLQDKVTEELEQMVRQGILVQPRGVTNASPVVRQRKKSGELRLCEDLKVHINGKVIEEDYTIPDRETILHNLHGASYFVKIDLSDAYYQIELDKVAKDKWKINTSQGFFKMCWLPRGLKNSSSLFQNCIESTFKGVKGVVMFQDDALVSGSNKEQFDKRILAVKSRLREKNFTPNDKNTKFKTIR